MNAAITGTISGIVGPWIGGLALNISKIGLQAAIRAGLLTGMFEALMLHSDTILDESKSNSYLNDCEDVGYSNIFKE